MYMGVLVKDRSGTKGTTGVERLEVMIMIGILSKLEQTFIVKSPISRSNTPRILNSFALSFSVLVSERNPEYSSSPLSSSSTNSCRRVNVSSSSHPDNKLRDFK